jgi:hypothetical protein
MARAAVPALGGATITKSTRLTQDLTNCPGVGIRIGADAITLDLNGHTVSAAAKRNPKAHGILNVGHDRVTIEGGTVQGFGAYGVRLAGVQRNHVVDMKMTANFTGIGLVESSHDLIERSAMTGSRFVGVNLTGGTANRVVHNQIAGSIGYGVLLQTSVPTTAATTASSRTRSRATASRSTRARWRRRSPATRSTPRPATASLSTSRRPSCRATRPPSARPTAPSIAASDSS